MQLIARGLLLTFLSFTCLADDWTLEKDAEGVQVFSRPTETSYNEVKAVTRATASPKALLALLDDTNAGPAWIDRCREVETLDWGPHERVVHTRFIAPWPLNNRDMITYSKSKLDKQTGQLIISISDKGQSYPSPSHYIRMRNVRGQWQVTPADDGQIEIQYSGYGEAAGALPGWLANKLTVESLHRTFVNMVPMIERRKYQPKS